MPAAANMDPLAETLSSAQRKSALVPPAMRTADGAPADDDEEDLATQRAEAMRHFGHYAIDTNADFDSIPAGTKTISLARSKGDVRSEKKKRLVEVDDRDDGASKKPKKEKKMRRDGAEFNGTIGGKREHGGGGKKDHFDGGKKDHFDGGKKNKSGGGHNEGSKKNKFGKPPRDD